MDSIEFSSFIFSPQNMDLITLPKLKGITEQYPYCQTGQLLLSKNLYNNGSPDYSKQLNIAAAYTSDRKNLYTVINNLSQEFKNALSSSPSNQNQEKEAEIIKLSLENNPKNPPNSSINETNQNNSIQEKNLPLNQIDTKKSEIPLSTISDAEKKAEFQRQLKLRLAEIAQESKKNNYSSNKIDDNIEKPNKNELIDKFIKEEPRLTPKNQEIINAEDLSKKSSIDDSEIISETLAQVYEKQGNYEKAILTYEKLSLKFPEKKTYFAAQIENIKKNNQY